MSTIALAEHQADILASLRRLKGRGTVGDVVSDSGLPGDDVRTGLKALLESHRGHLNVSDSGELLYQFDEQLIQRGSEPFLARAKRAAADILTKGFKAWIEMFDGSSLKPAWRKLITDHPDRFVFALDNVWGKHWNDRDYYVYQVALWRKALGELPSAVANAVTHGNSERLWKLAPVR